MLVVPWIEISWEITGFLPHNQLRAAIELSDFRQAITYLSIYSKALYFISATIVYITLKPNWR